MKYPTMVLWLSCILGFELRSHRVWEGKYLLISYENFEEQCILWTENIQALIP